MSATLADHWRAYRKQAMPADAGQNQVDETRNAFYGGAAMALLTVQRIGEDDISEDEGVAIIKALVKECEDYLAKYRMKHGLS